MSGARVRLVEASLAALDALVGVDVLALFVFQDDRPLTGAAGYADWRLRGRLSRELRDGFFSGAVNETLMLMTTGLTVPGVLVFGLGKRSDWHSRTPETFVRHATQALQRAGMQAPAFGFPDDLNVDDFARALESLWPKAPSPLVLQGEKTQAPSSAARRTAGSAA